MKKQLLAAVVGAALAFPLFAQAQGVYVGGNVGRSELKVSADQEGSRKKSDTGYKVYVSRPAWLYTRLTNNSGFFSCHFFIA